MHNALPYALCAYGRIFVKYDCSGAGGAQRTTRLRKLLGLRYWDLQKFGPNFASEFVLLCQHMYFCTKAAIKLSGKTWKRRKLALAPSVFVLLYQQLRQYLYFCTIKASKRSSKLRLWKGRKPAFFAYAFWRMACYYSVIDTVYLLHWYKRTNTDT